MSSATGSAPVSPSPQHSPSSALTGVIQTIARAFLEPEAAYSSLRHHPKWVVPLILFGLMVVLSSVVHHYRVPFDRRVEAKMEVGQRFAARLGAPESALQQQREQAKAQIATGEKWYSALSDMLTPGIAIVIFTLIGSLLYWGGTALMGQSGFGYSKAVTAWVYASLPPAITLALLNAVTMLLKPVEDLDALEPVALRANLSFLAGRDQYVLSTFLRRFDIFEIWGLVLAVIALSAMGEKFKRSQAVTIVVVVYVIGVLMKLGWSAAIQYPV